MRVRDFLQPATCLGEDASVADGIAAHQATGAVFVRRATGWVAFQASLALGHPEDRPLVELPLVPVALVAADDDIDVLLAGDPGVDRVPVGERGESLVGCVDRRRVLDAVTAATDPTQLGLLLLTRLIPTLLHDMANALAVADSSFELVRRGDLSAADGGQLALQHASELLRRARALAAGDDDPTPPALDVARVLRELLPLLETAAGQDVEVRLEVSAETPRAWAYRRTVERSILNLVLNARDALERGRAHPTGRICISAGPAEGGRVEVRVDDDGTGVPSELREHIFEAGVSSRRGPARGLGLTGVAAALHRVGGTVALASSVLGGACFVISLPAA